MIRACLDTDMASEVLKGKDPEVAANAGAYLAHHDRFTMTAVTLHEIVFGLEARDTHGLMERAKALIDANEVLTPDAEDFIAAGRIRGRARRAGDTLSFDDCLIAATAHSRGLPIVTGNSRHFEAMIRAGWPLRLINWREAQ
jgi:tRNA(fMet)-specific endonuclease VapC